MANEKTDTTMEDVQGIEQDIINQVLADEGVKPDEGEAAKPKGQQPATAGTKKADPFDFEEDKSGADGSQQQMAVAPPKGYVPIGALHEERQQRQLLQQQLLLMQQQQLAQQSKQTAAPVNNPATAAGDDDPLSNMLRQQLERVMPQYMQPLQQMQQRFEAFQRQQEETAFRQRVLQSEAQARAKYPDYDAVIAPIQARAQMDPAFAKVMLDMPDPAEYAYFMALGMQAQTARVSNGQAQVKKMEQMAAMPRSMQVPAGAAPSGYQNVDDLVDNFENLTPAQQQRLLMLTNKSVGG